MVEPCASWAEDQEGRFLEFRNDSDSVVFDLGTVHLIQPGRFTIIRTAMNNPDVMRFELQLLDRLVAYCERPAGVYSAPTGVFTLGPPDRAIKDIEVRSEPTENVVSWSYPYLRLARRDPLDLHCSKVADQRAGIVNGTRRKLLFDCKRSMWAVFSNEDDDPSRAVTDFLLRGDELYRIYMTLCRRVTHEDPYER